MTLDSPTKGTHISRLPTEVIAQQWVPPYDDAIDMLQAVDPTGKCWRQIANTQMYQVLRLDSYTWQILSITDYLVWHMKAEVLQVLPKGVFEKMYMVEPLY